jgi:hypothetical protein
MKKLILMLFVSFLLIGCAPNATLDFTEEEFDKAVAAVKAEYGEDYIPSAEINLQQLEEVYKINKDWIKKSYAEGPMMSLNTDMFIAIMATDGNVDKVEQALDDYREYLINESFQYPMNMAKVKSTQVYKVSNLVFLLVLGKYDDREEPTEEEALKFAQDEIQRAIDAIEEALK